MYCCFFDSCVMLSGGVGCFLVIFSDDICNYSYIEKDINLLR